MALVIVQATTGAKVLSKTEFRNHAAYQLGGTPAGMILFVQIMASLETKAETDELVSFIYSHFQDAQSFRMYEVADFLDLLVADADVSLSQEQRDDIINNWPKA